MEQVLRYLLRPRSEGNNFLLFLIGLLSFITFIVSILNTRINFYLWYYWHGHSQIDALKTIVLPEIPFFIFWLALTIFVLFKSKKILVLVPIISYFLLPDYLYYFFKYHENIGSLYYYSQALAFFGSVTLILGNFVLLFYITKNRKKIIAFFKEALDVRKN